jgi:hypothetical protein
MTRSVSETVPRTAAHVLGAPPVVHNLPTARTASASHRAQVAGAANVEDNRSGSTTPKDKSVTIPTAASDPAPKPSPHRLTKMFSAVAKGPIVPGNGRRSPRSSVPLVLTLAKGPNKPKGSVPLEVAHQEQVALMELTNTEGDFLAGLDDS